MEETVVEVKQFIEYCPICNKALKGYSEGQVRWIMKLHMDSKAHKDNNSK